MLPRLVEGVVLPRSDSMLRCAIPVDGEVSVPDYGSARPVPFQERGALSLKNISALAKSWRVGKHSCFRLYSLRALSSSHRD